MIRMKYDREADAVYVYLRDLPYASGKKLDGKRRIDYASDGTPIGVELLYVSDGVDVSDLPDEASIGQLLEKHNLKVFA